MTGLSTFSWDPQDFHRSSDSTITNFYEHFNHSIPTDADKLDCVTINELGHYAHVLGGSQLKIPNFVTRKESLAQILLLNFLEIVKSVQYGWGLSVHRCFTSYFVCLILCDSGAQFPFQLLVQAGNEKLKYTPRSDFFMSIRNFPHLLLEVVSQPNEGDRYRMLLQASCLARLGNSLRASTSQRPVVIMAIYIDEFLVASQYLLYQPAVKSTKVSCSS